LNELKDEYNEEDYERSMHSVQIDKKVLFPVLTLRYFLTRLRSKQMNIIKKEDKYAIKKIYTNKNKC
jgi:hypothetical protein